MQLKEEYLILIARHFKGETSSAEEAILQQWLEENDQNKKAYKELQLLWKPAYIPPAPNVDKAWEKVRLKAGLDKKENEETDNVRTLSFRSYFLRIAASLLIILTASYFIISQFGNEKQIVVSSGNQRMEIVLPDSSKIWLNKNSKIVYSENYNEKERELSLEGEAFFEVKKNPEKPFIVNGLLSKTQVLGTSFKVRSVIGEETDVVEVSTGKVSFEGAKSKSEKVVLLPGDKATVQAEGKVLKTSVKDLNSLSFKNEKLVFDNSTLQEVVQAAENYFDINVEITNSNLNECRFTGSFVKPDPDELLKVLSVSMNLSVDKKDSTYTLSGEGCR